MPFRDGTLREMNGGCSIPLLRLTHIARNRIISYSNAYIQLEKCSFKMRIGKSYVNRVAEVLDEKYYGND